MTTYTTKKLDTTGSGIAAAPGALADADLAIVGQSNDGNLYRTTLSALKTFFQTAYAALFVAKAGDTMTGPLNISQTSSPASQLNGLPSGKIVVRGEPSKPANFIFIADGVAGANALGARYSGDASGADYNGYKARGSEASPTVVNQFDTLAALRGYGWSGSAFVQAGVVQVQMAETTPSASAFGSRVVLSSIPLGSATILPVMYTSHEGVAMFASSNIVITPNRLWRRRVFTVAGLPATDIANGDTAIVTDATSTTLGSIVAGGGANRVPVNYDGTNWRIG